MDEHGRHMIHATWDVHSHLAAIRFLLLLRTCRQTRFFEPITPERVGWEGPNVPANDKESLHPQCAWLGDGNCRAQMHQNKPMLHGRPKEHNEANAQRRMHSIANVPNFWSLTPSKSSSVSPAIDNFHGAKKRPRFSKVGRAPPVRLMAPAMGRATHPPFVLYETSQQGRPI